MLTKAFGNMYPWVSVASICGSGILALGILMTLWWALHREDRVASSMEINGEDGIREAR